MTRQTQGPSQARPGSRRDLTRQQPEMRLRRQMVSRQMAGAKQGRQKTAYHRQGHLIPPRQAACRQGLTGQEMKERRPGPEVRRRQTAGWPESPAGQH